MSEFVFYVKHCDEVIAGFNNMENAELFIKTLKDMDVSKLISDWRRDYYNKTGLNYQDFLFRFDDCVALSNFKAIVDAAYSIEFIPDDVDDIPFA